MNEIEAQIRESIEAKERLLAQGGAETIERMARAVVEAYRAGRRLYVFGNGGSAADSQHLAGELVGRFLRERRALPCQAFTTDTSVLTAVGNDYGFEAVFERQVEAFVREGDVVLGISTSGNSPNVLRAVARARSQGATTLALSGRGGGRLAEAADICLVAPADATPRIQEIHTLVVHILCSLVEESLLGEAGRE